MPPGVTRSGHIANGHNDHPKRRQSEGHDMTTGDQASSHTRPSSVLDMKREEDRYQTFINYQGCISSSDLARAGFYYFGVDDHVRCAFCRNDVGHWEEGDVPLVEHKRHFPQCHFIRGINVGNVPKPGTAPPIPITSEEIGYDVCGTRPMVRPYSAPEQSVLPKGSKVKEGADLEKLGVVQTHPPCSPQFGSREARLQTFKLWPRGLKQKPDVLVEAGFFYTGMGDRVKCFYCDGGLADWEDDDDPWVEHARWFSRCSYVLQNKGKQFVNEVLSKKEPIIQPQVEETVSIVPEEQKMDVDESEKTEVSQAQSNENVEHENKSENREVRLCRVCWEEERGMVFLPCGHFVCCIKCAPLLDKCPVCRQNIEATVRTFLS